MAENVLYRGDNLHVLRRYVGDDSVDLIYLDPPFKSNQIYKVGKRGISQTVRVFEDVWRWDESAEAAFGEILASGAKVGSAMQGLQLLLGDKDMMAYLTMMAPRLVELHRTLKDTGSLYLHCDTTASHYLKLLLDSIFGVKNFRNEIIWYYGGRGAKATARQFPRNHDAILFYSKRDGSQYYRRQNKVRLFTKREARARGFRQDELGRWYKTAPRGDYTDESVRKLEQEGRIYRTKTGRIRIKYFLRQEGACIAEDVQVDDTWTTIPDAMHMGDERLGYPTQKPESLIERIIRASSNDGDVVLDPFCGCGTTLIVAQRLHRRWIGIESSRVAIGLTQSRLEAADLDLLSYRTVE